MPNQIRTTPRHDRASNPGRKKKFSKRQSHTRIKRVKAAKAKLKHHLKTATDQELSDKVLEILLGIKTLKQCEKRRDSLLSKAKKMGDVSATGKRCSKYSRCGNLACPICRRRAQLAMIISYDPHFTSPAKKGNRK